jgi:signal transduction histidine kinase
MTLRQLRWSAFLSAIVFMLVLEVARQALYPFLLDWRGRIMMDLVVLTGALFFLGAVFHLVGRLHQRLEQQNREMILLHAAALDIYGELSLQPILQKVVDQARTLLDARYGAISVVDEQRRIEAFVTSGISAEERARIGAPPVGHGLLGVVLKEGQRLRLADLHHDPRSAGFPPHHPEMKSLLAVPVICKGPHRANLYLAGKQSVPEFSAEDEETLVRFAVTAAIAIDSAHLHERLNSLAVAEERLRIAHEMHDGLAQVLAYVNTKAQAVKEFLRAGRSEEAARQLDQLAGAAREVYGDVRESIIGLRAAAVPGNSLRAALHEYTVTWKEQSGISCHLVADDDPYLPSSAELQVLRIVQEALTNVRKHSGARHVEVSLARADGHFVVTVEDDGSGFKPDELGRAGYPRFGLATMRERAESLGGAIRLESSPGKGTRVVLEIPVQIPTPT